MATTNTVGLLEMHRIDRLWPIVFDNLLRKVRREFEQFNTETFQKISDRLQMLVEGRMSLATVDTFENTIEKIEDSIEVEAVIADIIL